MKKPKRKKRKKKPKEIIKKLRNRMGWLVGVQD